VAYPACNLWRGWVSKRPLYLRPMFWMVSMLLVACSDGLGSIAIGAKEVLKRCVSIAVSMMTN
jgi:hypothetical protein